MVVILAPSTALTPPAKARATLPSSSPIPRRRVSRITSPALYFDIPVYREARSSRPPRLRGCALADPRRLGSKKRLAILPLSRRHPAHSARRGFSKVLLLQVTTHVLERQHCETVCRAAAARFQAWLVPEWSRGRRSPARSRLAGDRPKTYIIFKYRFSAMLNPRFLRTGQIR